MVSRNLNPPWTKDDDDLLKNFVGAKVFNRPGFAQTLNSERPQSGSEDRPPVPATFCGGAFTALQDRRTAAEDCR